MHNIVHLVLRRMRAPLLVLLAAYVLSMLGMVAIEGVDREGRPWSMDFFHAFYFTSYMATTIGFGEVPYEFSRAQRLWVVFSIYISVVAWIYAIGNILALVQDPALKQAFTAWSFSRHVKRLREGFYLVCGYGDTGGLLVRALTERGLRAVVIDIAQERISELRLEEHLVYVPGLCADAGVPLHLLEGGLQHPSCAAVIALTNDDSANLQIAIAARLLNPRLKLICRAQSHDIEANMRSFGTRHIIDPFDTFAFHLALALHSPSIHLLHEWLTGVPKSPLVEPLYPPRGKWVLCGYGRFGKAVKRFLDYEGVPTVIVETNPERAGCPEHCVVGRGTEAVTLRAARIQEAAGIVAGTSNDADNLSIVVTARDLNPRLFVVTRQNKRASTPIFEAAHTHLVMQSSYIIAREILALLTTPLLARFLQLAHRHGNEWANLLVSRISAVTGETVPEVWVSVLSEASAAAVHQALSEQPDIRLDHLLSDPRRREARLPCLALLLLRAGEEVPLPADTLSLRRGDTLLFCGRAGAASSMAWTLQNHNALSYVVTGLERPDGTVWRWLARISPRAGGKPGESAAD